MKHKNQGKPKQDSHNPSEDSPIRHNPAAPGQGVRQYESGRNPDMQVQRTNRQGDGNPTQQSVDDR